MTEIVQAGRVQGGTVVDQGAVGQSGIKRRNIKLRETVVGNRGHSNRRHWPNFETSFFLPPLCVHSFGAFVGGTALICVVPGAPLSLSLNLFPALTIQRENGVQIYVFVVAILWADRGDAMS